MNSKADKQNLTNPVREGVNAFQRVLNGSTQQVLSQVEGFIRVLSLSITGFSSRHPPQQGAHYRLAVVIIEATI
jgi:hypothetical protein